jgi:hypothetical protein
MPRHLERRAAPRRAACAAACLRATTAIAATPHDAEAQLLRRGEAGRAGAHREQGRGRRREPHRRRGDRAPRRAGRHARSDAQRGSSRLEITPERIDAFVVAMQPMVAAVERRRAESARQAAYTKRKDAWTACTDSSRARVQNAPPATAGIEENGKWMDRSADYQVRSAKAGWPATRRRPRRCRTR